MPTYTYSRDEILDMLRRCKAEKGMCTPRGFNEMDDTCSASAVMKRFGTWTAAKEEAGIVEDASSNTGRNRTYTDEDILDHLRRAKKRMDEDDDHTGNGTLTVRYLQTQKDLVSPSVAVERFGSWSDAKTEAGLEVDDLSSNSRPRKYSDEDYIELLQECEEKYGKVTQDTFNDDDEFPTAGAVRKRFADENGNNGWSRAKKEAGVDKDNKKWTDEELLEQLRECQERKGTCSAAKFAAEEDFASPETLQRRFGSWNEAKEKAGLINA